MVAMMGSKKFDPAEHLTKQGWKGKGTGKLVPSKEIMGKRLG